MPLSSKKEPAWIKTNLVIFTIVVALSFFGLIILFSASSFPAQQNLGDAYYYVKKQSLFVFLGFILLIINSQIPYRLWYNLAWPAYLLSIALLVLVFVPFIGQEAGGARRWIRFSWFSCQPSDIAKFTMVLLIARLFAKESTSQKNTLIKAVMSIIIVTAPAALVSLEPDLGTAFHLAITSICLLFLTDFSFTILLMLCFSAVPVIYYNVIQVPWRIKRVLAFLDPWEYRYEEGYQLVAALKSFLAGGLGGQGLGESMIRHRLQARHTDFIFAMVAEDLGFIGVIALLFLFLFIAIYGIILLKKIQDSFGRLLGIGILLIFVFQVSIHVAVNMGLIPTKGLGLPFISYGGTSTMTYLFMFGLFLNICKSEGNGAVARSR